MSDRLRPWAEQGERPAHHPGRTGLRWRWGGGNGSPLGLNVVNMLQYVESPWEGLRKLVAKARPRPPAGASSPAPTLRRCAPSKDSIAQLVEQARTRWGNNGTATSFLETR